MSVMTLLDPVAAASAFLGNCVLYAVVVFHLYEWIWTLSFELGSIWSKPASSIVKWQYLYSRYIGLIANVINAGLYARIQYDHQVPLSFCRSLFYFHAAVAQSLLLSLNISLIYRLRALYSERPCIPKFLAMLVGVEFVNSFVWGCLAVHRPGFELKGTCVTSRLPIDIFYILVLHTVVQGTLWLVTIINVGVKSVPIVSLVLRDNSMLFGVMLAVYTALMTGNRLTKFADLQGVLLRCMFPISTTLTSSANCHIIRSMEGYSSSRKPTMESSAFELDTVVDTRLELSRIGR